MSLASQLSEVVSSLNGAKVFIDKLEKKGVASSGTQARALLQDASKKIAELKKSVTEKQKSLKGSKEAKTVKIVEPEVVVIKDAEPEVVDVEDVPIKAKRARAPKKKTA